MLSVKAGRPAVSHIVMCVQLLGGKVNLSVVKVVITTVAHFSALRRSGGIRFLVIYLKAAHSMLQQSIGGQRLHDLTPFGARIGRTNGGIPRFIPALHRARIRKGDVWAIRFWLTLLGLYRVLEFPGKVKLHTITNPSTMDPSYISEFSQFVNDVFVKQVRKIGPEGSISDALWASDGEGPLEFIKGLRAKPFLISTSGPHVRGVVTKGIGTLKVMSSSPAGILHSARLWLKSPLYPALKAWCEMTGNTWVLNRMSDWAKSSGTLDRDLANEGQRPSAKVAFEGTEALGKLGFKSEPAGKVRVFAMVDPWTQWLLNPLHQRIFNFLQALPQDGTFDQVRPLERLISSHRGAMFSFDLSAATDRIPIVLQKVILSPFLTAWGAELWASLLIGRGYVHAANKQIGLPKPGTVYYGAGQPMGALSSWAMLALTHHCIVQKAALRAGAITSPEQWFDAYAVLGDDVVIIGSAVARQYRKIMATIGVEIGDHKSLVSRRGTALEFAKRTFLDGKDVSGIPLREFVIARQSLAGLLELIRKYPVSLGQYLAVLGFGYRAKASVTSRIVMLPKRLRNYVVSYYGPGAPAYTGLVRWLALKSVNTRYAASMERVSGLVERFAQTERELLLGRLDQLAPLIAEAKRLATVYRDREHYGTVSESAGRQAVPIRGVYDVPRHVIDSLNETVYREAFLDTAIEYRDLRASLEELDPTTLDWDGLDRLWAQVREIESGLGSLPLPRSLDVSAGKRLPTTQSALLKRWYRYSSQFRSTVTQSSDLPL